MNAVEPALLDLADDERSLVVRAKRGERAAFDRIIERHRRAVFQFAYGFFRNRDDALEIVQETFLRLFEKLDLYDDEQNLQAWILRLARNLSIDYYRKYKKKQKLYEEIDEKRMAAERENTTFTEVEEIMSRCLDGLSERQRSVFLMKHQQGLKLEEIAGVLDISLGTVKTLHHRAVHAIRKQFSAGRSRPAGEEGGADER